MPTRLYRKSVIILAVLFIALPTSFPEAAPDLTLALQGLLTGDKTANDKLIGEFLRGYAKGNRAEPVPATKQNQSADKTKVKKGRDDQALDQAYQRGFSLGRRDREAEERKSSKR